MGEEGFVCITTVALVFTTVSKKNVMDKKLNIRDGRFFGLIGAF